MVPVMSTEDDDEIARRLAALMNEPDEPPPPGLEVDDEVRQNAAAVLTDIALARYQYHRNQFGDILTDVKIGSVRKTMVVGGSEFHEQLLRVYKDATGNVITNEMLKAACKQIIAETREAAVLIPSAMRKHKLGEEIYIDLCNNKWQSIKVNKDGWSIVDSTEVDGFRFLRTTDMRELKEPANGGDIHDLGKLLNLSDEIDFRITIMWLLSTLTNGPYPILSINGPEGAAKSTATVIIGDVLDPINNPKRAAPKDRDALLAAASSCHVQRYDNMSKLPDETSDTLCGMSTGITITKRKLYTDNETVNIQLMQPLIMNGIPNILTRKDLASRTLALRLSSIKDEDRKTETDLYEEFATLKPALLGAILDVAVYGLKNKDKYKTKYKSSRMADSMGWWLDCSDLIGGPEKIVSIVGDANEIASVAVIENSYTASCLLTFLKKVAAGGFKLAGGSDPKFEMKEGGMCSIEITMGDLWKELKEIDKETQNKGQYEKLPGNARGLTLEMDRIETSLGMIGVNTSTRPLSGRKLIKFTWMKIEKKDEHKTNWGEFTIKNLF